MFEFEDVNTEKRKEIFKDITEEDCTNLKKQIDKLLSMHKQDLMLGVCKEFELVGGPRDGWIIHPKCKLGHPNITGKWMSVFLTITLGEPYENTIKMCQR